MSEYSEDNNGFEISDKQFFKGAGKVEKFIDSALEAELASIITNKSVVCGLCCAIPFFGLETAIYAICLWGMYGKIADKAKTPFRRNLLKNITAGFVVNIVVVFVLNHIFEYLTFSGGLGLILSFFVGYIGTKTSGAAYVGMLKLMHGKKAEVKFDVGAGLQAALSGGNSSNQLADNNCAQIPLVTESDDSLGYVEPIMSENENAMSSDESNYFVPYDEQTNGFYEAISQNDVEVSKVCPKDSDDKSVVMESNKSNYGTIAGVISVIVGFVISIVLVCASSEYERLANQLDDAIANNDYEQVQILTFKLENEYPNMKKVSESLAILKGLSYSVNKHSPINDTSLVMERKFIQFYKWITVDYDSIRIADQLSPYNEVWFLCNSRIEEMENQRQQALIEAKRLKEAKERLSNFQQKLKNKNLASSIKIAKVIDNEKYKCLFFLGNLTGFYPEGEGYDLFACIYAYDGINDIMYILNDKGKFQKGYFDQLSKYKMVGYDGWGPSFNCDFFYSVLEFSDRESKNDLISIGDYVYYDFAQGIRKISLKDFSVEKCEGTSLFGDRYIIFSKVNKTTIGEREYNYKTFSVKDVSIDKIVSNPFFSKGNANYFNDKLKVSLKIDDNGKVEGNVSVSGINQFVIGSKYPDGKIDLKVVDDDFLLKEFHIYTEQNKYKLSYYEGDIWLDEMYETTIYKQ